MVQLGSKKVLSVQLLLISIYFKRSKSYSLVPELPNLSGMMLHVSEMHGRLFHVLWNPPKRESSIKISPTGFNDVPIKGMHHRQALIKRGKSFCRFAYLFMKRLWNIYKCFPDICLQMHFRAFFFFVESRGSLRRSRCGGRKSGEFGTVLSISVSRICQGIEMCH